MKKIIGVILSIALLSSLLCSCNNNSSSSTVSQTATTSQSAEEKLASFEITRTDIQEAATSENTVYACEGIEVIFNGIDLIDVDKVVMNLTIINNTDTVLDPRVAYVCVNDVVVNDETSYDGIPANSSADTKATIMYYDDEYSFVSGTFRHNDYNLLGNSQINKLRFVMNFYDSETYKTVLRNSQPLEIKFNDLNYAEPQPTENELIYQNEYVNVYLISREKGHMEDIYLTFFIQNISDTDLTFTLEVPQEDKDKGYTAISYENAPAHTVLFMSSTILLRDEGSASDLYKKLENINLYLDCEDFYNHDTLFETDTFTVEVASLYDNLAVEE